MFYLKKLTSYLIITLFLWNFFSYESISLPKRLYLVLKTNIIINSQKTTIDSKVWYDHNKIRVEINGMPVSNLNTDFSTTSNIIGDFDKKVIYLLNTQNKVALRIDTSKMSQSQSVDISSPFSGSIDLRFLRKKIKELNGKMIKAEKILGHLCDVFEIPINLPKSQEGKGKVILWFANDLSIPLKWEMYSSKSRISSTYVTQIETNAKISSDLFQIPFGYKITDINN